MFGHYAGIYVQRNIGDQIKSSLKRLSSFLATVPKLSYADHKEPITFVDVPAVNALVGTVISDRDNNKIATNIVTQMAWINKIIAANGLVASGPMRIVTNYSFDVVQPVTKDGATEGDWDIQTEGKIVFEKFPAGRAVTTDYTGYATGLDRERQVIRAWAMVKGAETDNRAYEEYLVAPEAMMTDTAKFKVYWPIK